MVAQGRGLIVIISSMGGLRYLFNVPYGVGKAAVSSSLLTQGFSWKQVNILLSYCLTQTGFVWWFISATGLQQTWPLSWKTGAWPLSACGRGQSRPSWWISSYWRKIHRKIIRWDFSFSKRWTHCWMAASSVFCFLIYFSSFSYFLPPQFRDVFANGETTELSGRCIVNLANGEIIDMRW